MTGLSVLLAGLGLAAIAWHRNRAALRAEIERDEWRDVAVDLREKHEATGCAIGSYDNRCAACREYDRLAERDSSQGRSDATWIDTILETET